MSVELTDKFFSDAAGWDVMKRARAYLEQGQVLSSYWAPPLLRGVVRTGEGSLRASLVIHGPVSMENLCTCRDARQWGKICSPGSLLPRGRDLGQDFGKMESPAGRVLGDLFPATEAISDQESLRGGVTDSRQQDPFG